MTSGVRERAPDERFLEPVLEAVADVALAARERLRKLAASALRQSDSVISVVDAGDWRTSGGRSAASMR